MSIKLEAPYPRINTTTFLPNPLFNDSEGLTSSLSLNRTMGGNVYTYIKTSTRKKIVFNFEFTRQKGLEFRAFLRSYFSSTIRLTDHLGSIFIGKFTSNPFELTSPGNYQNIQIEFEGIKQ